MTGRSVERPAGGLAGRPTGNTTSSPTEIHSSLSWAKPHLAHLKNFRYNDRQSPEAGGTAGGGGKCVRPIAVGLACRLRECDGK